jgi:hypothetical protein
MSAVETTMRYTAGRLHNQENVFDVRIPYQRRSGWSQRFLLTSDRHCDHPCSDLDLQYSHLREALVCGAGVLDFGDFFCAMQGPNDPRGSKKDSRDENQRNDYYDSLVDSAEKWFSAYADNFIVIAEGNHETNVVKRHGTSLTNNLIRRLNTHRTSGEVFNGRYTGFVRFMFEDDSHNRKSVTMRYEHGSGGGGPVTKGVIQTNRRAAAIDADIFVSGHVHESWCVHIPRIRLSHTGKIQEGKASHLSIPGYKREWQDGISGWHVERGAHAKPIGAWWIEFYYCTREKSIKHREWSAD